MFFATVFILGILACIFSPFWWFFVPVTAITAFFLARTPSQAFWSGFGGISLAWTSLTLFRSIPNGNILARRMAAFFFLPNWIVLIFLTACLAGLLGGLGAYCGYLLRQTSRALSTSITTGRS